MANAVDGQRGEPRVRSPAELPPAGDTPGGDQGVTLEALTQSIIEHSRDCIKILDMDGRLKFMSEGGRRLLRIQDMSCYLDLPYETFWQGSDRQATLEAIARARAGQVGRFQGFCPTEDGTPKWWDVVISPILGAGGEVERLLAVSRDVTQQKQAEDALRESEARYRLLVECLHDGIWLTDPDGISTFVNPRMADMLGYARDEMLGTSLLTFVDKEDQAIARAWLEQRGVWVRESVDLRFRRKDGTLLYVDIKATPILDADGKYAGVLASIADLTQRRQQEQERERLLAQVIDDRQRIQALSAQAQRRADELSAVLNAIPDPVAVWDARGNVLRANPAAANLGIGDVGAEAALVAERLAVRHADGRPFLPEELPVRRALQGETVRDDSEILVDATGEEREIVASAAPVVSEGEISAAVVVAHDVTQQRCAEAALRASEERLRTLVDLLPVGISILDKDRRIVLENSALHKILGLSREELQAGAYRSRTYLRSDGTPVPAEELPSVQALRENTPTQGQIGVVREDGSLIWIEVNAVPVALGDWQVVITTADITLRKQAEQTLLRANEELERRVAERSRELLEANQLLQAEIAERRLAEEELRRSEQRLEQRVAERTRELATLLEISNAVALSKELEPLLAQIVDLLQDVVRCDGATIYRLEEGVLLGLLHRGPVPVEEVQRLRLPVQRPSLAHDLLSTQAPVHVADAHADTPVARAVRQTAGAAFDSLFGYVRTWLGIPLAVKGVVVGLLTLQRSEPGGFDEREVRLAQAFAGQLAVALENARLYQQAQELATLEERQRLARELHDAVSQTLFSASLATDVLPRLWQEDREAGLECLAEVRQLTRGALAEMRNLLLELRPSALAQAELVALLRQLADAASSRMRIPVAVHADPPAPLPAAVRVALYRIAQEALNNVAKHAGAREAAITLRCTRLDPVSATEKAAARVELSIADDGRGFEPGPPGQHGRGMGLAIMRERAEAVGAALEVASQPGKGTRIAVRWPADSR